MKAVMVVPAATPPPESAMPTDSNPEDTAETVRVVKEMPPVAAAEPAPAGQKEPAAHAAPAGEAAPAAHVVPALHGFAVAAALPAAAQKPAAQESAPVRAVLATVWAGVTVYVPAPPAPVPSAVMVVPAATPAPDSAVPTNSALEATAVTVSTLPAIAPVTLAPSAAGAAGRPWGQKKPAGHALVVPAACPARQ
jgi:hypothetical protein